MARGEPLYRQWNIIKAMQAHRFGLTVDELAESAECSRRQVQRDLKILFELGFPVEYEERDFGKRFWRIKWHQFEHEPLTLSPTETISLYISQQLLAPLGGTQFGDSLTSALNKIKAILPLRALDHFRDLDNFLLVKNVARHDYSGQNKEIRILNEAIAGGNTLKIRYSSASQGRDLDTLFDPYGLVFFGVNLYCIGLLEEYNEIRTLKISRFKGIEVTGRKFQRPENFSLSTYMQNGFGIIAAGKLQTIRVRFTGWAATNVREQSWHQSQKILQDSTGRKDNSVVATFELPDTTEFKRWLLGFGRHAVVQSPKSLAGEIKAEFRAACGAYGICCEQG